MATITEDYCSKELSLLLDKKGFDGYSTPYSKLILGGLIPHSVAMKWLREIHLILYIIYHNLESGELRFSWRIYKLEQDKKRYVEELPGIGEYYKDSDESFTTYKEAEESLIKYCLENLI